MTRTVPTTVAELYVRSLAPGSEFRSQERAFAALDDLVERGSLAIYDVYVWGDAVSPTGVGSRTHAGRRVLDRVARIEGWATETGATVAGLRPGEHRSRITGERWPVTRLPSLALAEYDAGRLVHFAPHVAGEENVSVARRLRALAESAPPATPTSSVRNEGESTEPDPADGDGGLLARDARTDR
jgi:hypothetical protein